MTRRATSKTPVPSRRDTDDDFRQESFGPRPIRTRRQQMQDGIAQLPFTSQDMSTPDARLPINPPSAPPTTRNIPQPSSAAGPSSATDAPVDLPQESIYPHYRHTRYPHASASLTYNSEDLTTDAIVRERDDSFCKKQSGSWTIPCTEKDSPAYPTTLQALKRDVVQPILWTARCPTNGDDCNAAANTVKENDGGNSAANHRVVDIV
ncbi:hypothetical protein BDZ89DRAFT_1050854 [Hymenopellis radicata]|nr:hypothetical protein BDZ89DRAFT_1050854 [Hymenopellis radicata]